MEADWIVDAMSATGADIFGEMESWMGIYTGYSCRIKLVQLMYRRRDDDV